ncbi:MAG: hypothetical protein HWE27_13890 [Gammaproteobacteria bacterium]|nr:hypothetical protein [Gammaproteobacteria bacterium]
MKHHISWLMGSAILIACLSLQGCTTKNWYQAAQENRKQACIKEPPGQYQACLEQYDKSFEEYEAERREALGDEK